MDEKEEKTELQFLDTLYRNLTALREDLTVMEQNTSDYQTRQQLTVKRRALEMELQDIANRRHAIKQRASNNGAEKGLEPGA